MPYTLLPDDSTFGKFTLLPEDKAPAYNAAQDTPAYARPMINIGAGLNSLFDFARQQFGDGVSDAEIKETRARDKQLADADPVIGKAYQLLGQSLPLLAAPATAPEAATAGLARMVGPAAARALSAMGMGAGVGAATGAAQPVTSQESRPGNAVGGAILGAALPGAFAAAGPAFNLARRFITQGGAADKAGFSLAERLAPGDLDALQAYIQSKQSIPSTVAEITQNPTLAVAERQANLRDPAGAADFLRAQMSARDQALQDATAGADKLDAAKFARDAATEPLRSDALSQASKNKFFFTPVLETAQAMASGGRGSDPAVKKLAGYVENELSLTPRQTTTGNETPSIYGTLEQTILEQPQSPLQKSIAQTSIEQPQHGYGGVVPPAPYSPVADTRGPIAQATPERLYTIRKVLLDKLNGPAQLGDELSSAAKARRSDVMRLVDSIDGSLDDATNGAWGQYLEKYADKSKEVNSAEAQQLIRDSLENKGLTATRLQRAIDQNGANRFGPTLDEESAAGLQSLLANLRQSEGIQRLVKSAGTSGGGSNTAMDMASDMAQNKITSAIPIVSALLKRSDNLTQAAMADALRNPQLFITAVSKAQRAGQPLTQSQDAILRILRAAGSSTPALLAPQ